ncbi:hypothetical protein [Methanoregula formicica]|uniref:Lipoprotein n=1 Tax=Methanoregula formicica (strain DSM 22288 / NBRC 105244 / SMSP) TaxID=593750 RepID=L0HGM2_METFS|nr:hypothetical protein [Methanoregula formicica]AGB02946.1 hypothetical protein Metfor_1928 [Methanoregula formicica SMSP]
MTNDYLKTVILFLAVFFLLAVAGCTSPAPSSPVPASSPVPTPGLSTVSPAEMALQPADLPGNFTLLAKGERNISDMRSWAVEHGWKRGYFTGYMKTGGNVSEGPFFEQVISVYSTENITLIVEDTINTWKSMPAEDSNVTVEEISLPTIGDYSRSTKASDRSDNTRMYVIAFVKDDVYEQFQTDGNETDFEILRQMAVTAAAKIR